MKSTLYLKANPETTGNLVLLSGDPARVELFAEKFPNIAIISRNREYTIATGEYQGQKISIISAGIGGPSTAIALEELKSLGVKAVVRIGTMMGITAPMGTVIIPNGSVREEGTSLRYLPLSFPALPDWNLQHCLVESGERNGLDVRVGLSATFDAFYPNLAPDLVNRPVKIDWEYYRRAGILSADMETALIFTVGTALGLPTAAMCLVTVQSGIQTTFFENSTRNQLEQRMLVAALEGIIAFAESRQDR